jgi:hypothetical protein
LKILTEFNEKFLTDGWNWKILKDEYHKLTLFKVWGYDCKNDEKSKVVSEFFSHISFFIDLKF